MEDSSLQVVGIDADFVGALSGQRFTQATHQFKFDEKSHET